MKKKEIPKIIKNKKGALSGIISSIGHTIQSVFTTLPKPLLFILFLAILLLIGALLPTIFQAFGTFCDSGDNPVSTGINIFSNVGLMTYRPDADIVGSDSIKLNKLIFMSEEKHTSCSEFITEGTIVFDDGTRINISDQNISGYWVYDGTYCTNCDEVTIEEFTPNIFAGISTGDLRSGVCWGEVEKLPDSELSWLQRTSCGGSGGECEPPDDYKYDPDTNRYECSIASCGGKTAGDDWDDKLRKAGATPIYTTGQGTISTKHTGFVGIKCRDIKPRLSIFGIEIFDYRLWVIIMLLVIGIWALKEFG